MRPADPVWLVRASGESAMPAALGMLHTDRPDSGCVWRLGRRGAAAQLVSRKAIKAPAVNAVVSWRIWALQGLTDCHRLWGSCQGLVLPLTVSTLPFAPIKLSALILRLGASAARERALKMGRVASRGPAWSLCSMPAIHMSAVADPKNSAAWQRSKLQKGLQKVSRLT